jgi:hypothetical protein
MVAITLNEQPGKIPVNNPCGLMCWGEEDPWGWKFWPDSPPVGYALIQEGEGGMMGVFLAFADVKDALARLLARIQARDIATPEDYAQYWVAEPKQHDAAVSGFTATLAKVEAAWPKG